MGVKGLEKHIDDIKKYFQEKHGLDVTVSIHAHNHHNNHKTTVDHGYRVAQEYHKIWTVHSTPEVGFINVNFGGGSEFVVFTKPLDEEELDRWNTLRTQS